MRIKTTLYLFLFPFLFINLLQGQSKDLVILAKNKNKLKKEAERAYEIGDVFVANEYYDKLLLLEPSNADFLYRKASCEMMARNYYEAESLFQRVYEKEGDNNIEALYYWALMQKSNGKYQEAKDNFEKFRKKVKNLEDRSWTRKYRNELEGCDLAIALEDSLQTVETHHLGGNINYPHIEFSPIPLGNGKLIYGSNKTEDILFYNLKKDDFNEENKKEPVRKLYIASKQNENWVSEGELEGPFNDEIHSGNGAFSLDGRRFYFTKCAKNDRLKTICRIYYSDKEKGSWSKPVLLNDNINLSGFTNTQPTVGLESRKGREVLYFVSDRPEGKGGWDIWYSIYNKKKNTFSVAKNAGRKINSIGTECTPYYHSATGKFYFSSDGHPSIGGLDVFEIIGEKSKWEEARNIGLPINSSADDLSFIYAKSIDEGFFVSNRKGGMALDNETCCDDIYSFMTKKDIDVQLLLEVFDDRDGDNIEDAKVSIYEIEEGEEKLLRKQKSIEKEIILEKGKEYWIEVNKEDFVTNGFNVDNRGVSVGNNIEKKITIQKIKQKDNIPTPPARPKAEVEEEVVVSESPIILENIYFEYNSDELLPESKTVINETLLTLLNKQKRAIILIGAHTDSKGSENYNNQLSQRRAQSVVNYLISKGISSKRLRAKGYGESMPIEPNTFSDGTDNPGGRMKNRRVEFSIVGKL